MTTITCAATNPSGRFTCTMPAGHLGPYHYDATRNRTWASTTAGAR